MRYGVSFPNFGDGVSARSLADLAAQAEAVGWDGFFLWDHLFAFMPGPVPAVDPWIALAAIALKTERVLIGPMVTPLPRRRPVKLARETATLDHLSGGRLVLGVGIGAAPFEWDYLAEETDAKIRGAMLDEGLEVLTGLWRGEPFRHRGTHYRVAGDGGDAEWGAVCFPPPVQRPRIPIWVAGTWPRKPPFRRAARWDGVFPIKNDGQMTPDDVREMVGYVAAHRGTERDPNAPFEVVIGGASDAGAAGTRTVAPLAEAGATWWVEGIDPWRFGYADGAPWPVEAMHGRIRKGPPRG